MDIAFNITRKCNKGCEYCYLNLDGSDISTDIMKSDVLKSAETVTLTGGETLLYPGLDRMLYFFNEQNKHIHLLTNGIKLYGDIVDVIAETRTELFITYNQTDAIIKKNMMNAYSKGIDINIHHVLSQETLPGLESICKDIYFAKSMLLLYPTKVGESDVEMYGPDRWFGILGRALDITSKNNIKTYFEQAFASKDSDIAKDPPCPTGKDIFVDTDMKSYPCCLMVDSIEGHEGIKPISFTPERCSFLKNNPLPQDSPYIRICPIVITDAYNGSFNFPSHTGGS